MAHSLFTFTLYIDGSPSVPVLILGQLAQIIFNTVTQIVPILAKVCINILTRFITSPTIYLSANKHVPKNLVIITFLKSSALLSSHHQAVLVFFTQRLNKYDRGPFKWTSLSDILFNFKTRKKTGKVGSKCKSFPLNRIR